MDKDNSKSQKARQEKVLLMLECIGETNKIITSNRNEFGYPPAAFDRIIQLSFAVAQNNCCTTNPTGMMR